MSRIIEEMYESAKDMYDLGVIDKQEMRKFEAMYRESKIPKYTGEQIKEIRSRLDMDQPFLATVIQTTENAVRAWESGAKKPGRQDRLLLNLLDRKGLKALS